VVPELACVFFNSPWPIFVALAVIFAYHGWRFRDPAYRTALRRVLSFEDPLQLEFHSKYPGGLWLFAVLAGVIFAGVMLCDPAAQ